MNEESKPHSKGMPDLDKESKQKIEEMAKSDYFDYLAELKLKEKAKEAVKKYRSIAIIVNAIFIAFFGFSMWEASDFVDRYEAQAIRVADDYENRAKQADDITDRADALVKSINNSIESMKERSDLMDSVRSFQNDVRKKLLDQQQDLNDLERQALDERLQILDTSRIFERLAEFREISMEMIDLETKLSKSHKSLNERVETIVNLGDEIKMAASITHLFIERGDKEHGGHELRPARIKLPYSKDWLEARFHTYYRGNDPKQVLLDIYGNSRMLFEDLFLTDSKDPSSQTSVQFCSSDNHQYEIKPVFIYLPPNFLLSNFVPGYGRVPDFVILEIRLTSLECMDETIKVIPNN